MRIVAIVLFAFFSSNSAIADPKADCIAAGNVVRDAIRAEAMRVAFNEEVDWQGVEYFTLPKKMRAQIQKDIVELNKQTAQSANEIMIKAEGWSRQGMDGRAMAREILYRAYEKANVQYAVLCLKNLPENR